MNYAPSSLKRIMEADKTLLVFAFFGYIIALAGFTTTKEIIYGFGFSLIILGIMISYSLIKRVELASTSLVIFGVGLGMEHNSEFLIYVSISITLILISVINKSINKLVVGDLFLGTVVTAAAYIIIEGVETFADIMFLFSLLTVIKYVVIVYYLTEGKKPDLLNNIWAIVSALVVVLKVIL